jgi:hypothetical protein
VLLQSHSIPSPSVSTLCCETCISPIAKTCWLPHCRSSGRLARNLLSWSAFDEDSLCGRGARCNSLERFCLAANGSADAGNSSHCLLFSLLDNQHPLSNDPEPSQTLRHAEGEWQAGEASLRRVRECSLSAGEIEWLLWGHFRTSFHFRR